MKKNIINLQRLFPTAGKWHNSLQRGLGAQRGIRRNTRPLLCQRAPHGCFPVSPGEGLCLPLRDVGATLGSAWLVHSSCTDSPVPQVGHGLSPLHSWDLNLGNISGIALGCLSVGRERSLMGPAPQHWTVKTLGMLQMQNGAFWKQNPNNVLQDALFPTFFFFSFLFKIPLWSSSLYFR